MREYEKARFYCACPHCGAPPGERCVTQDGWRSPTSNHPARNRAWREMQARAKPT